MAEPRAQLPGSVNLAVAALAGAVYLGAPLLVTLGPWWAGVLAVAAFAAATNTCYALAHEALHGLFHRRRWLNEGAGILLSATTPIGFTIQRAFHLKHHRGNRGDEECFDLVLPGQSRWQRRVQFYGILTGEFLLHLPVASLLWLACPWLLRVGGLRDRRRTMVRQHGAAGFLDALERLPPWRSRLEVLLIIALHAGAWWALGVAPLALLACYAAFAVTWGGMQYAIHAYSPREVRAGAWNLRCPWWLSLVLCHYPLHRAHHLQPELPWTALPKAARYTSDDPGLVQQWWRMWRQGPIASSAQAPQPETDADDFMARALS